MADSMDNDEPLHRLEALLDTVSQAQRVKAQQETCGEILEWLGKHWDVLLDKDGLLEENLEDHPADQLLREALGLFDKCRAAKLEAQKQLPMRMTRSILFGVSLSKKDLLIFGRPVMRELFKHCETMLRKEETYLDGAALLAEVLDVPGYRQHADLMWLVSIASWLLETACNMDLGQDKKRVHEALKIVPVIMRELCRDAGTGKKLHDKDHDAHVVEKLTMSFKLLAAQVQNQRTEDQLLVCYFMKALNEFLLTFILDHRSCAEKLHPTVLQVIKHFWKEGGMDPLKKNFVQYMRLVMRAQLTTSVNEIESLIERLKADVAKAARGTDEKRGLLTYDETIAIELFVDLLHVKETSMPTVTASISDVDRVERPAKRRRPASSPVDLEELCGESMFPERSDGRHPRRYMQVLFLHLVKYPEEIPLAMRSNLVHKFARAFEKRSFDDLDVIWAMRCVDELLATRPSPLDTDARQDWARIYSNILNIINGRRTRRMEAFEVVALNLLTSIVSDGAVEAKDIEERANMGVVWKLLVTNWGQGMEFQARSSTSVSSSVHASQARESAAGRLVQDPVSVDVALTAFLVAVLNRVSLSHDSISVEGVTCCRRNLLSILRSKVENGQNAQGHQSVTRLKLTARLMVATFGSGYGAQGSFEDSKLSCSVWHMRGMVSEVRRAGPDNFKDLDGDCLDIYSLVHGRSGPDFVFLDNATRDEIAGDLYRKPERKEDNAKVERSLTSIGNVSGWFNAKAPSEGRNPGDQWVVHVQTPQEEVRQLSTMCLEVLQHLADQDSRQDCPSSAFSPHLILAVCLFESSVTSPTFDKEWARSLDDHLFGQDILLKRTESILSGCNAVRPSEKVAVFESMEDVVDSLLQVHLRILDESTFSRQKIRNVLNIVRTHCEKELRSIVANGQGENNMDLDDDFGGLHRNEIHANAAYEKIRFRIWVKISSTENITQEPDPKVLQEILDKCHSISVTLDSLNVLFNFGVPLSGEWSYDVDLIKLVADSTKKFVRALTRTDEKLLCLKAASLMVENVRKPGLSMTLGRKRELLKSIRDNAIKWQDDEDYHKSNMEKGLRKAHRVLRQTYVLCAAAVVPLAVECHEPTKSRALPEFISKSLNDSALEVRFAAAKGLSKAIRGFATPDKMVSIFKDVLERLRNLDDMAGQRLLSSEAKDRTIALVFGAIAAMGDEYVSVNMQAYCVAMLCSMFTEHELVINSILDHVASCQKFSDATELVRAHMPSILREWWAQCFLQGRFNQRFHWTEFPMQLGGYRDRKTFVRDCVAPTLVPELLLHTDSGKRDDELKKIASSLMSNATPLDVAGQYYAHVYSRVVPLVFAQSCKGPGTLDDSDSERLKRAYDYITSQLMNARRNTKDLQITLCLLDVILNGSPTRWDPDKTSTHWSPSQTEFVVIEALKYLSSKKDSELFFLGIKRLSADVPAQPRAPTASLELQSKVLDSADEEQRPTDFLSQIYLHLLRAFKGHNGRKMTRQQKTRVLFAMRAVITCLGKLLRDRIDQHPWVLRHTISILLTAISDSDVARLGCEILKDVIWGVIDAHMSDFLGEVLGDIICTLVPQVNRCALVISRRNGSDAVNSPEHSHDLKRLGHIALEIVEKLVEDITKRDSQDGLDRIRSLPPFPKSQVFDNVRAMCSSFVQNQDHVESQQDINVFLQMFQDLKEPVPAEVQKATLQHLHEQLRENSALVSSSPAYHENARAQLINACIYKLLAWTKMADTYAAKDRSDLLDLISKCLGQFGPTLTSALSLQTPIEKVATAIIPAKGDAVEEFLKRFRIEICVTIVIKLRSYLEDDDVRVVEEAVTLLKGIFAVASNRSEDKSILEALASMHANRDRTADAGSRAGGRKGKRASLDSVVGASRHSDDIVTYIQPFLNPVDDSIPAAVASFGMRRNQTAVPPCHDSERTHWATTDDSGRSRTYEEWVRGLAHHLCKTDKGDDIWPLCAKMCTLKTEFAEMIFPSLLFSVFLSSHEEGVAEDVAADMGQILTDCIFGKENDSLKAIRLVLHGLDVLRLVRQSIMKNHFFSKNQIAVEIKTWEFSYFFHVPYINVAKAARRCGAHLSALLYMELDRDVRIGQPQAEREVEDELLFAYRQVMEPDGLDAFNTYHDFRSRFIAWEHHGEHAKSIGVFDNLLDLGASSSDSAWHQSSGMDLCLQFPPEHGICDALQSVGFSQLSFMAASSFAIASSALQTSYDEDVFFESAWRAQAWQQASLHARPRHHGARPGYHANIFAALKELASVQCEQLRTYAEVADSVRRCIGLARKTALEGFLRHHDSQSTKHNQSQLVRLQICEDIDCFLQAMVESSTRAALPSPSSSQSRSAFAKAPVYGGLITAAHSAALERIRDVWHSRYKQVDYQFPLWEPLISLHTILLGISPCSKLLDEHLCLAAKLSMKQGNMSFARCSMQKLQISQMRSKSHVSPSPWWIREAKVLRGDGQVDKAANLMKVLNDDLCKRSNPSAQDCMLWSRALAMYADLSSRTESSTIVTKMLGKCVDLRMRLRKSSDQYCASAAKAHFKLAAFNDQMFTHMQSQHVENKEQQSLLKQTQTQAQKQERGRSLHKQSLQHHGELYANIQKQRSEYLKAALYHYMKCIELDAGEGRHDGAVFRVLHLWFEPFATLEESGDDGEEQLQAEISKLLQECFESISDLSVFTGVARQVLSRLDDINTPTQKPMQMLLSKLLKQRPQELLLPTFYIATLEGKKKSAENLINSVRQDPRFAELVKQTEELKDAYVELAKCEWYMALPDHKGKQCCNECPKKCPGKPGIKCELKTFAMDSNKMGKLSKIQWNAQRKPSQVRVPTAVPASRSDDIDVCVAYFDKFVEYPGGITRPKKIKCHATNAQTYTQIVKSEDPRTDVMLSQIFSLVNNHFARDAKCRQRQLELGTYVVVALGDKSCVLEFVDNAASLSSILGASSHKDVFSKSLHGRYASAGEWTYGQCFKCIGDGYAQGDRSPEKQLDRYRQVCRNVSPVFRHYFAESTCSAPEWFELRLKYTRSVAASSMAGHIVGLGDRHLSNILIRETGPQRGSLVHIDLGIIFDQARHLPRPEQVPFRLTRDMIDGMGRAGTNGVMARCSHESLRVMRENKHSLLAIIDVLLHDPLDSWKMSDEKRARAHHAQDCQGRLVAGAGNDASNDARIMRKTVKDKLEGWVRGELLSVQGQVKHLIREATSEENLSLLYQGWGAWY